MGSWRDRAMDRLAGEHFDVLVIGGGITGAGVALDAAARGLRTALVDRGDLASGTSSRSSKLVHGGLRYLQQREFALVRQNLAERQRLLRNAPHLVRPVPFIIPLLSRRGLVDRAVTRSWSAALWGYDLAGGAAIGSRHRRIGRQSVLDRLPGLRPDLVTGGFVYHDAQADDARLTLAVARTAVDHGAVVVTHAPVVSLRTARYGRVAGAELADGTTVVADAVVNATGVWADAMRRLDGDPAPACLRPARGAHLTLARERLPWSSAAVLAGDGGRSVFVVPVPGGDRVYVGTTDTAHDGPLEDPHCTTGEVAYLLGALNAVLAEPLRPTDVMATWAGLRPLVAAAVSGATADLSRRHRVSVSPSGMITVTGGKLTTYRAMAADAVDQVGRLLRRGARQSPTARLALHGHSGTGELRTPGAAARLGVPQDVLDHLVNRHGGEASALVDL
ncbi:MAG: glycerol-3-phosphate dehydrogenase/oxidase, partial [Acidimicrobiales bacterium]